jgi:ureidoglycolate hydrolase
MCKEIKNLNSESFKKYGYVIEHDDANPQGFQVQLNEYDAVGWRIATLKIEGRNVSKLHRHPQTMETFEPVKGVSIILAALPDAAEEYEAFLLDKPVCLFKNVWHATLTLSEYAIVKITENVSVSKEEFVLPEEVFPVILDKR